MGKTNTNSIEYETLDAVSPDVLSEEQNKEVKAKGKKNGASRVFAAIFAALGVAMFFLPIGVIVDAEVKTVNLLGLLMDIINGRTTQTIFGILPVFTATTNFIGKIAALSVYFLALMIVLAVITGIIAIFHSKKAPCLLRTTVFFLMLGTWVHFFATYLYNINGISDKLYPFVIKDLPNSLLYLLIVAGISAVAYFILSVIKLRSKALVNALQLILTLEVVLELVYILFYILILGASPFNTILKNLGISSYASVIKLVLVSILALDALIACIRMQTKKGLVLDLIRYIVQLLLAGALSYLLIGTIALDLSIIATAVSLAQIIICVIQLVCANKKKKAVEETIEEDLTPTIEEEYVQEEYAEAVPYEGGPVAGVELAEEVTSAKTPASVQTAAYDFYNSKSVDPFIATLSNEERNQFTELFILKYKGVMPEIPDYEVGGNNKEFFRKVFIYLGQYRDRIPDELLAKIYQFAIKI